MHALADNRPWSLPALSALSPPPISPDVLEESRIPMADTATQRFNMVEAQVRTNDVTDPRIHAAMNAVPRERFVPAAKRAVAYADTPVEIAPGRFLLDPRTFAKLLQLANLRATDKALDVGCATGYSTVVLAKIVKSVVGLEQDADLVRVAADMVPSSGVTNASVMQGGLTEGARSQAPFDMILINGAVEAVPDTLLAQLAEGGRLVTVLNREGQGQAHLFVREHGGVGSRKDFDATVPLLAGFKKVVGFVF
jgi:protein-L-isoaspartate(D-aspartate) O-methyltransferase